MMTDSRFEDDSFDVDLEAYLELIGGPRGPSDSPTNPVSHYRLQGLYNKYGKSRVERALHDFFKHTPNW